MNSLDLLDNIVTQISEFINQNKPYGLTKAIHVADYSGLLRADDLEQIHVAAPAIRICWLNDEASKPIALGAQDVPMRFGLTIITKDATVGTKVIPAHRLAIAIKDNLRVFLPQMILPNLKEIALFNRAEAMDSDLDENGSKRLYVLDTAFKLTWHHNQPPYDKISVTDDKLLELG